MACCHIFRWQHNFSTVLQHKRMPKKRCKEYHRGHSVCLGGGESSDTLNKTLSWPVLIVHYLVINRIKPYNGIHQVHRPVFQTRYLRKNVVRNAVDALGRYTVAGLLLQDVAYHSCVVAVAFPKKRTVLCSTKKR